MNPLTNEFTRDYYENGKASHLSLYENYRWLPELTIPMAQALIAALPIKPTDRILDYGCAKGYLVKALRQLGHEAFGTDISTYALSCADDDVKPYVFHLLDDKKPLQHYNWIIAKDVLEHIEEDVIRAYLASWRTITERVFIAVPLGNNGAYTIPEMELDVTHRIRRPLWWWAGLLEEAGFTKVQSSFSMRGVKENWTRKYQFGNGFLTAQ